MKLRFFFLLFGLGLLASAPAQVPSIIDYRGGVAIGGSPTGSGGMGSLYTYSWTPTTGLDNATAANPTASPTSTTTYAVTVTDSFGCSGAASSVTVTVNTCKSAVTITSIVDNGDGTVNIYYNGGAGTTFTLLKSSTVPDPAKLSWTTAGVLDNGSTLPGSFVNVPKSGDTEFFTIRSN